MKSIDSNLKRLLFDRFPTVPKGILVNYAAEVLAAVGDCLLEFGAVRIPFFAKIYLKKLASHSARSVRDGKIFVVPESVALGGRLLATFKNRLKMKGNEDGCCSKF